MPKGGQPYPSDRKKVGDVDPAGKKAFDAEMSKAAKPAPAKPAAEEPIDKDDEGILEQLGNTLLNVARRARGVRKPGGGVDGKEKTVMDVVDEAVAGAKEDAP